MYNSGMGLLIKGRLHILACLEDLLTFLLLGGGGGGGKCPWFHE